MTPHEAEELATLWTNAQPVVAAFIRSLVPRLEESDDLLQRTAVVLVRKFHEFDRGQAFVAWAVGVAKVEVLAYWRERSSDRLVFDDALVERIADGYQRLAQDRTSLRELLIQCVAALEERARKAIQLRYVEQMKTPRIAEALGLSHGAARVVLTRARTTLRLCIEKRMKQVKV
jgi:RNA polymerase sigma-70 factor, ECF subfamily